MSALPRNTIRAVFKNLQPQKEKNTKAHIDTFIADNVRSGQDNKPEKESDIKE